MGDGAVGCGCEPPVGERLVDVDEAAGFAVADGGARVGGVERTHVNAPEHVDLVVDSSAQRPLRGVDNGAGGAISVEVRELGERAGDVVLTGAVVRADAARDEVARHGISVNYHPCANCS